MESLDKMRRNNHMFDNLMEQILLSVASQYVPKLQNIACTRANELTVMKEKIQHLQAKWFDKEIEKLRNVKYVRPNQEIKQGITIITSL
ncbi:MAG: hypothetical protein ACJ709_03640 [Nitrososphaeraceae archaeon]